MSAIKTKGFHHVAYRCRDAKETVEFYQKHLGMDFQLAIAEDHVPSTGAYDPYMHIFLDAGNDNVLAFFELPDKLVAAKESLEAADIEVLGPTHHGIFKSIYFFDPNGHRLELAADISTPEQMKSLYEVAPDMLEEWSQTKKAPRHAAWLHEKIAEES